MPTECPVCKNVNPRGVGHCLRCNVKLVFVEIATAPVPERTEPHQEENVIPQPEPGCPHCGFEGNAIGAIRCFSCKTPLSSWLLSGRLPANNFEPSITATVCGYLVMIIGGLLATTYVFSALFVFQRPGRGTPFATFSGIAIGIAFALAIARAGLRVLKGEPNSRPGLYIALTLLGLATGLATVTGYRTGSPVLTAAAGGVLALLVLIAIAFSRDHAGARN